MSKTKHETSSRADIQEKVYEKVIFVREYENHVCVEEHECATLEELETTFVSWLGDHYARIDNDGNTPLEQLYNQMGAFSEVSIESNNPIGQDLFACNIQ